MVTRMDLLDMEDDLEVLRDAYLRERRWISTYESPGALLTYSKTWIDGRILLVNKTTALQMQKYLEDDTRPPSL